MRYRSLFFIAVAALALCQCKQQAVEEPQPVPEIFTSNALQDSLTAFASSVDSLPNPYGAPTAITVIIEDADEGASVSFMMTPAFQSSRLNAKYCGMCRAAGKPLGIFATSDEIASALLITDALDTVLPASLEYRTYYDPSVKWSGWFPPSRRYYTVSEGGAVTLDRMQVSRYERFHNQFFEWPKQERRRNWQPSDIETLLSDIEEFDGVGGEACELGGKLFFKALTSNTKAVESALSAIPSTARQKTYAYFKMWFRSLPDSEKKTVSRQVSRLKSPALAEDLSVLIK